MQQTGPGEESSGGWKVDHSKFWPQKPLIMQPTPSLPPSVLNYLPENMSSALESEIDVAEQVNQA